MPFDFFTFRRSWAPPKKTRVHPDLDVYVVPLDASAALAWVRRQVTWWLGHAQRLDALHEVVAPEAFDALNETLGNAAEQSDVMKRVIDQWCQQLKLPRSMLVQQRINVRAMPPAGGRALDWHSDAGLGEAERQWTLWIPLAGVDLSNTVGFRAPGIEQAVVPQRGEAVLFGAHQSHCTWRSGQCAHSRVSLDLRFSPDAGNEALTWRPRFRSREGHNHKES